MLTLEQFRERMVDYLYEMLEGEELRAFEAYLGESAEARRELASLQRTLRSAREGLAQHVDAAPPARVRVAVLAAAQAHAASRQLATRTRTPADELGFWSRLRASWLLPALAVAAAVSLVVFGKNIESPKVMSSRAAEQPKQAAPSASPPSAASPASESTPREEKTRPPEDAPQAPMAAARARAPEQGFAAPPPAWVAKRARATRAEREARDQEVPTATGASRAEPEREAVASEDQASAQPSTRRAGAKTEALAASEGADSLGSMAAPAPAKPSARAAAPVVANDAMSESDDTKSRRADDASESALVHRAREHFAAKRWQRAEADYRELLRRFPNDTRAPIWRKQLDSATKALHDAERDAR